MLGLGLPTVRSNFMLRHGGNSEGPGDHSYRDAQLSDVPGLSDTCETPRDWAVRRRYCIRNQTRLTNSLGGLARWQLGWRLDLPEKERDAITRKAKKMIKDVRAGDVTGAEQELLLPHLDVADRAVEPFGKLREDIENDMREAARLTPAMAVVNETLGFGTLGLAVLIGVAGSLSEFRNAAKLIKYLGLAPKEEYPRGEKKKGRKVPRCIKGEIWGTILLPMRFAQIRNVKENGKNTGQKFALAPEGELYLERQAAYFVRFTEEGGKTPMGHANNLAALRMLKDLVVKCWASFPAKDGSPREYTGNGK